MFPSSNRIRYQRERRKPTLHFLKLIGHSEKERAPHSRAVPRPCTRESPHHLDRAMKRPTLSSDIMASATVQQITPLEPSESEHATAAFPDAPRKISPADAGSHSVSYQGGWVQLDPSTSEKSTKSQTSTALSCQRVA